MLEALPAGLVKYSQSPVFTEDTVPPKLMSEHSTKSGVWGQLVVSSGALDFVIPGPPEEVRSVRADHFAVIEPEIIHFIRIKEAVSFYIEFYKSAT